MMDAKLTHVALFCVICVSQLHVGILWRQHFSFIETTIQLCHTMFEGHQILSNSSMTIGQHVNTFHGGSRDSVTRKQHTSRSRLHSSPNQFWRSYMACIHGYWKVCFDPQTLSIQPLQQNTSLHFIPCYHGNLNLPNHDYLLHIQVNHTYQINLTFTYFYLEYSHPHCNIHHYQGRYTGIFPTSL